MIDTGGYERMRNGRSRRRALLLASAAACAVVMFDQAAGTSAFAQSAPPALPPVTVDPPRPAPRVTPARPATRAGGEVSRRSATRARPVARVARRLPQAPISPPPGAPLNPGAPPERGDGPVAGFVATRTTSGSKTDTPIIETPQAVSVIGKDQITTLGARQTVLEATRYSPGILSETFGPDPRNDFFLIRGFDASQTGTYLDNLQFFSTAFATFKIEPFGMERIEILRGPSSVLYGGSNPGGILNAISKKPTGLPLNYIEYGVNEYGNMYGAFDFEGPKAVNEYGTFSARITGIAREGGTQTQHTDDGRIYVAPSVTWRPNADTSITFLGSYLHDDANGRNFLPYAGTVRPAAFGRIPTQLFTSEPQTDKFKRDQILAGYQFEHRVNEVLTVRQNVRYSHVEIDYKTLFGAGYASPPTFTQAQLARFNFVTTPQASIINVDNQAEFRFDTGPLSHTALLGFDYRRYSLDDTQGFSFGPSLNLLSPMYSFVAPASSRYRVANVIQDQIGLYAQDQIKFDRFTLVASVRQDFVRTDTTDKLTIANSSVGNDSAISGRVGLIYTSDIGLAPYVSYSRSFVPQIGFIGSTSAPLAPEFGEQYEAGIKYQPFGNLGYIGAAVFDLKRQNVSTTDPTFVLQTSQTGEVRSKGFEVEAVANLMEGLKFVGAYTAYDFETTRSLDPTLVGKVLPNVPQHFGSAFLDYTVQDGWLKGFGLGGGVRYVGTSFADPLNQFRVPQHVLGDIVVHYERAGWRAQVNMTNFLDETYVAGCSSTSACFYGERRKILGSLSYTW